MRDLGSNEPISKLLEEISGYLFQQGDNSHKAQAYKKAALIVKFLPYDLMHMEKLTALKGIGTSIAYTIEMILATGSCPLLKKLRREFGGKTP